MFEPCPYPQRTRGSFYFVLSLLCQVGKGHGARARGAVPPGWDSCGSQIAVPGQGRCCGRYLPWLLLCWAPAECPRLCLAFPDMASTPLRSVPEGCSVRESRL